MKTLIVLNLDPESLKKWEKGFNYAKNKGSELLTVAVVNNEQERGHAQALLNEFSRQAGEEGLIFSTQIVDSTSFQLLEFSRSWGAEIVFI